LSPQIENAPTKNRRESELQSAEFSRILLIKPSALGDVVHTIPVLVKLRARYPRARIDWLITRERGGRPSPSRALECGFSSRAAIS